MKKWHYESFRDAIGEKYIGCIWQFPELSEALTANGISLHPGVTMRAVREICRLILAERKTKFLHIPPNKELQDALLEREIYVSNDDIAETYSEYCESWAAMQWAPLDYWDHADHIGPVDYIAARVGK